MACDVTDLSGEIVADADNQGTTAEAYLAGLGCCIRDSSQYGGGYCALHDNNELAKQDTASNIVTATDVWTYFLTNDEFKEVLTESFVADESTRKTMSTPVNTRISTLVGIETFAIADQEANYVSFNASKAQPAAAAGWSDKYRFEKGDKAKGYIRF